MIVTFEPPLAWQGTTVASVTLREPLAREVLAAEKARGAENGLHADLVRDRTLVAKVAGVEPEMVKLWPMPLFRAAERYVNAFSAAAPKEQAANLDAEMLIDLEPAIEKHNRRVDLLELRPPTAGEVETAQRELGSTLTSERLRRYQIVLVALVSGHPRAIVEELPIRKLDQASQYLQGFT